MTALLAGLSFGAPYILGALIVLPAVWWLLRVTPPLPRRIVFPPLRLLLGAGAVATAARASAARAAEADRWAQVSRSADYAAAPAAASTMRAT